jgi:hypothetical protein
MPVSRAALIGACAVLSASCALAADPFYKASG